MNRNLLSIALAAGFVATSIAAASAATLEYTFNVPYDVKVTGADTRGPMSISCAVGPASLGYSTATNDATNATGSGTTQGVSHSPATVVVTVDAELRGDRTGAPAGSQLKSGAGGKLQPTKEGGYYTCWAKFNSGVTPVNFLPTTALPKQQKTI